MIPAFLLETIQQDEAGKGSPGEEKFVIAVQVEDTESGWMYIILEV